MFDDFSESSARSRARTRFGGSMAAALMLYGGFGTAIVLSTTVVRQAILDEMVQVEFAPPPPETAPPPPPQVELPSPPRPRVKRPALVAPEEVPDEKPEESDAPLADDGEPGPVDGFLDGTEGGTGAGSAAVKAPPPALAPAPPPPPPPRVEPLVPPVEAAGNVQPSYSGRARRKGIEGVVIVAFEVLEDGRVSGARIVSGPEEFHENVLKVVATWRFQPAQRGKKAVRYPMQKRIRFRLDDI